MTHKETGDRNRANARKSTGPRTSEGKAVVATNALKHGATARPKADSVAAWLSVILDRPDISPSDLMPEDEVGYRALALAQAEARLVAAEQSLTAFEAGNLEPTETTKDLRGAAAFILDELTIHGGTKREMKSGLSLLRRIARIKTEETRPGGKRHRLLRRYVLEARSRRWKAFEAWAAYFGEGANEMLFNVKVSNSQNKARLQPLVEYTKYAQ
jgi:hypothetical protein